MESKRHAWIAALACALAASALAQSADAGDRAGVAAVRASLRSEPFFTEVFASSRGPLGVVITLHRGAWSTTGAESAASEHPDDRAWLRRGWLVVNSSYRPGAAGLPDVRSVYKRVDLALHRRLPVCLDGASSGGNLALLAAARLPNLACVVAEGAPSDLVDIGSQTAYDPSAAGGESSIGPTYVHDAATQALGASNLSAFSPLFVADRIKARVLLAEAKQDPLIPVQQLSDLCSRLGSRCAGWMRLAPGPLSFVHARVDRGALSSFRHAETLLAERAVAAFSRAHHAPRHSRAVR